MTEVQMHKIYNCVTQSKKALSYSNNIIYIL